MDSDDINIEIKESLGDNMFINFQLKLKCKTSISINGKDPFLWEGYYKGKTITVQLQRGETEDFAQIINNSDLNIDQNIRDEIKRIIRKLD